MLIQFPDKLGAPHFSLILAEGGTFSQFLSLLKRRIQIRQRTFEHLPMPWIARNLQLLQDSLAREFDALASPLLRDLLAASGHTGDLGGSGLFLLLFNRLAFPSASHIQILSRQLGDSS